MERCGVGDAEVPHGFRYASRKLDAKEQVGPVVAGHPAPTELAGHDEVLVDRVALCPVADSDLPKHDADDGPSLRRQRCGRKRPTPFTGECGRNSNADGFARWHYLSEMHRRLLDRLLEQPRPGRFGLSGEVLAEARVREEH